MPKAIVHNFLKLRDRLTLGQQVATVMTILCLALVITVAATAAYVVRQQADDMVLANHLAMVIVLIGIAFAVIGVAIAAMLARGLTRPLAELADTIDAIGRDPGATMIARDHSSRDIAVLTVSIRSLLRRLGLAETGQESALREAAFNRRQLAEKTQRLGEDINALQVLADTDALTGLLNRRAFRVFGGDAMNYFKRHKRDVGRAGHRHRFLQAHQRHLRP